MELDDVLAKRRSIRKYMNIPVEKDKWTAVIESAQFSASCGNLQDWKIIIVRKAENRKKLAQICHNQMWMAQAGIQIIVCADMTKAKYYYGKRGVELFAVQDCAVLMQNMILKATDLGLSTCWVGSFDDMRLRNFFSIPPSFAPQAVLVLGYGDEDVPAPPRSELVDITSFEQFGQRGSDFGKAMRFWHFGRAAKMLKEDAKTYIFDIFKKKKE